MDESIELSLIGRIQTLLINLHDKGITARSHMLWLFLGLVEAGYRIGQVSEAEASEYERMVGEMLALAGGKL